MLSLENCVIRPYYLPIYLVHLAVLRIKNSVQHILKILKHPQMISQPDVVKGVTGSEKKSSLGEEWRPLSPE